MLKPLVLAVGCLAAAAIPATAAATTSNAKLFRDPSTTAVCGIEIHPSHTPATELLCSANGIPRAKHGIGDPFVQIGAAGSPQLVLISQDSYVTNHLKTLSKGTLWRSIGVTCNVGSGTILCFNADNHGVVIGNGKYRSF